MNNQDTITEFLAGVSLGHGVGEENCPCSIAAINLAINGRLDDTIPECMSPAIGSWIITVQDSMPIEMINSPEWRELLPLAAGTGRNHEKEIAAVAIEWMWADVLPQLQDQADKHGYGDEWRTMCKEKTRAAARAAYDAADADAAYAYAAAAAGGFGTKADPIACLRKMIEATSIASGPV